MPACCRAETSRYGQSRAARSPAPDRRCGRHCRTTRWRRRAGSAPSPALGRVWQDRASCRPIISVAQPANQVGDMLRRALTDFVIHGAQLLSDARLNFTPRRTSVLRCVTVLPTASRISSLSSFGAGGSMITVLPVFIFRHAPSPSCTRNSAWRSPRACQPVGSGRGNSIGTLVAQRRCSP